MCRAWLSDTSKTSQNDVFFMVSTGAGPRTQPENKPKQAKMIKRNNLKVVVISNKRHIINLEFKDRLLSLSCNLENVRVT